MRPDAPSQISPAKRSRALRSLHTTAVLTSPARDYEFCTTPFLCATASVRCERVIVEGGNARLPTEAAAAGLFSSRPLRRSSCSGFPRRACAAAVVVARMPETSQRRPGRFGFARSLRGWASGLVFAPTCLRSRRIGGQVGARRSLLRRALTWSSSMWPQPVTRCSLGVRRRLTRRRRFTTLGFVSSSITAIQGRFARAGSR
jgi:hypothetical protein